MIFPESRNEVLYPEIGKDVDEYHLTTMTTPHDSNQRDVEGQMEDSMIGVSNSALDSRNDDENQEGM